MNSPQLWVQDWVSLRVLPPTGGGGCRHHGFVCGAELSWQLQARGAPGVALQKRSWAPTFVWQMGLMTQEDCPLVGRSSLDCVKRRRRGLPEATRVRADYSFWWSAIPATLFRRASERMSTLRKSGYKSGRSVAGRSCFFRRVRVEAKFS